MLKLATTIATATLMFGVSPLLAQPVESVQEAEDATMSAPAQAETDKKDAGNISEYPICSKTVTDSCINPRAAGKKYGNVALEYWPGKPASELTQAERVAAEKENAAKPK